MAIIATKPEGNDNFERIPAGTHNAVVYAVWDLGNQKTVYNGKEKIQHKAVISWEIDKTIKTPGEYQGKRYVISKRYTLSLFEGSHLRKDLESWLGSLKGKQDEAFDIEQLIGKGCMINIMHVEKDGKTYANVAAVMALPVGTQPMIPENGTEAPEWVKKIQAEAVPDVDESEAQEAFGQVNNPMESDFHPNHEEPDFPTIEDPDSVPFA